MGGIRAVVHGEEVVKILHKVKLGSEHWALGMGRISVGQTWGRWRVHLVQVLWQPERKSSIQSRPKRVGFASANEIEYTGLLNQGGP